LLSPALGIITSRSFAIDFYDFSEHFAQNKLLEEVKEFFCDGTWL